MQAVFEKIIEKLEEQKKGNPFVYGKNDKSRDASVSRQTLDYAIEIVKQEAEQYEECYNDCGECEAYNKEKHHCPKFCKVIKETVKEIEENHNGWIPCSEMLPKITEEVLVTQFFEDSGHHNVTNASLIPMLDGSGRIRWCCYDHFITHVIAWQPLPQPYQPKGE